jgi:hypothetical protein
MKRRCPRCQLPKSEGEWYPGKNSYCIQCISELGKDRRKAGGATFRKREAKRLNEHYKSRLEVINSLKNKPCADCGHSYPPWVMDFDHVIGKKSKNIATMLSACVPMSEILKEIEKCEAVCANCHRQRTHDRTLTR